jgi:glycerate-2-kinase
LNERVQRSGDEVTVRDGSLIKTFTLKHNIRVVGFGKAVLGILRALQDIVGDHIASASVIVPIGAQEAVGANRPEQLPHANAHTRIYEGALNNVPDEASVEATRSIVHELSTVSDVRVTCTIVIFSFFVYHSLVVFFFFLVI